MSFYDESAINEPNSRTKTNFTDTFLVLSPEYKSVFQVLTPTITKEKNVMWKHYVKAALRKSGQRGISIVCPGISICPICAKNALLNDRKHEEYIAPQKRIVIQVLDLTPTKVCPVCESESYTPKCYSCGYDLEEVEATPCNKVKLFERGTTLFQQLALLEESVEMPYNPSDAVFAEDNQNQYIDSKPGDMVCAGITRFPITISSKIDAKGGLINSCIPGPVNTLNWRDYEDQFVDMSTAYFTLTPVEVSELVAGGSLSVIFKARNSAERDLESASGDI